jgi:hypothetical protein
MKGCLGRRIPAAALSAALLFCLFPFFAAAQEGNSPIREERIETGRFGTEEADPSQPAGETGNPGNKLLYLGLRLGPSLRMYTPFGDTPYTGGDTYALSMDTAFQINLRLLSFLSIQGEAVFTWDNAPVWDYITGPDSEIRYTQDYTAVSIQFPLMVKLDLYPGKFRVSPFLGAYYFWALGDLKNTNSLNDNQRSWAYDISPPLGLLGGLNGAIKLGAGMIFADLRYTADLGTIVREEPGVSEGLEIYRRSMVSLTLGYEWGFFAKKGGDKK